MKTRIIRTDIYTDEVLLSQTPDIRFICIYLYTNSHIGLTDIYKIPIQLIQLETGYDISSIKIALNILKDVKVLIHHNYLWIRLLRKDFASLVYSGEKNDIAIEKYLSEIPQEVKNNLLNSDTSINTSIYTSDKSEIRNTKLEILNKDSYGESGNIKLSKEEYEKLLELLGENNLKILIEEMDDYLGTMTEKKAQNKYSSHYKALRTWARRKMSDYKSNKSKIASINK